MHVVRISNPSVQYTNIISYTGNPHNFKVICVPTTSRVVLCTCRCMCCSFSTHDYSVNLFDFHTRKYVQEYVREVCTTIAMSCVCTFKLFLQMRYFVVHFWSKIRLFVCVHQQQNESYSSITGTEKL